MPELPLPVATYVQAHLLASRSPAYLLVRPDGSLAAWGGELARYGITDLQPQMAVEEQVPALVGLLPLEDSTFELLSIEIAPGLFADLHMFPADVGVWVLFLDATADVKQRYQLQQKANEMALLQEDYVTLMGRQPPASAMPPPPSSLRGVVQVAALLGQLFQAMDIVVLERMADGTFRLLSAIPAWLPRLYPEVTQQHMGLQPGHVFPFLAHFLEEAQTFWQVKSAGQISSGPWRETDATGQEYALEALAFCLSRHQILCLTCPKWPFAATQALLQRARDERLVHLQLQRELAKKDILLHCIVHDLTGPLTAIVGSLSLLAEDVADPAQQRLLTLSLQQAQRQQQMIHNILDVFATEMGILETFARDRAHAPDVLRCAQDVMRALAPAGVARRVTIDLAPTVDQQRAWQVVGETSRLERVIFNLMENALRHSSAGSSVRLMLEQHDAEILVAVDDQGPGVPPHLTHTLFEKFTQGADRQGQVGLGLYFCRITVEQWGGTIGYTPRTEGGSRFWFRLPCPHHE